MECHKNLDLNYLKNQVTFLEIFTVFVSHQALLILNVQTIHCSLEDYLTPDNAALTFLNLYKICPEFIKNSCNLSISFFSHIISLA